jgi:hypothetical protein
MAVDLSGLQAAVARNTSVDASAVVLIRGISQRIKDAIAADDIADATNINALVTELDASSDKLADAVTQNTTPEPTPAPTEPPV